MLAKCLTILTISVLIQCGHSSNNLFTQCKLSDSKLKLNVCLKENAQKMLPMILNGIPDIELKPFDPFDIENTVSLDQSLPIRFNFSEIKFYGMNTTIIKFIELNTNTKKIILNFTNTGTIKGAYSALASFLPGQKKGHIEILLKNFNYQYAIYCNIKKDKDDKRFWRIAKHRVSYTPGKVVYKFIEAIDGNEGFTDWMTNYMNSNWRECLLEYMQTLMKKLTNAPIYHIDKIFAYFPEDSLFLS